MRLFSAHPLPATGIPVAQTPRMRIAGPVRTARTLEYAVADPIATKLPRVLIPTVVVRGSQDPIATQSWVEEMVRLLPAGRLVVVPGAAHVVNYTAPGALAGIVREFLVGNNGALGSRGTPLAMPTGGRSGG